MTRVASTLLVSSLLLAGSCTFPLSEVVLVLDTSLGVPCAVNEFQVEVQGMVRQQTTVRIVDPAVLPATVTLVRDADSVSPTVTVTARLNGVSIATAQSAFQFQQDETLMLPLVVTPECLGGPCPLGQLAPFSEVPAPQMRSTCTACIPSVELCNGMDDDCNGVPDDEVTDCAADEVCATSMCVPRIEGYEAAATQLGVPQSACLSGGMVTTVLQSTMTDIVKSGEAVIALPFPFEFYGTAVSQIAIGVDGYIRFGDAATPLVPGPETLDDPSHAGPALYAFYDDLQTRENGVCIVQAGAGDYESLRITWDDVCFQRAAACDASDHLTFHVILEETTNAVRFAYGDMASGEVGRADGGSATIGVKKAPTVSCAVADCDEAGRCASGGGCGFTQVSHDMANSGPGWVFSPTAPR